MRPSATLFHAVIVVGTRLAVPALEIGALAVPVAMMAGCGDDDGTIGIGVPTVDIGVPIDHSFVVDIGIAPVDMAHD
jgi:hypothetical protein